MTDHRIRVRRRQHRCYELAARGQMNDPTWTLVHGSVKIAGTVHVVGHAWLERAGIVYDPVSDQTCSEDKYLRRATTLHRYTAEQAVRMMLQHEIYGPWEEDCPALTPTPPREVGGKAGHPAAVNGPGSPGHHVERINAMVARKSTAVPAAEIPAELPRFILEQDELARRARLVVSRSRETGKWMDRLVTRYHGTPEQIVAAGFVESHEAVHWPKGRCPSGGVNIFTTAHDGRVYRDPGGTFYVQVTEDTPQNLTRLGLELVRYEYATRGSGLQRVVHYGSRRALLAAGIVTQEMVPEDLSSRGMYGGGNPWTWETLRSPRGWWVHIDHVQRKAQVEEQRRQSAPVYESPTEWLEKIEDFIVTWSRHALMNQTVETAGGRRFRLDDAAAADVLNAIEAAAQRLRDAKVTVMVSPEKRQAARERSAGVSADRSFQRWMASLGSPQPKLAPPDVDDAE